MTSPTCLLAVFMAGPVVAQEMAYVDTPVQGRETVIYAFADVLRAIPTYETVRVMEHREECTPHAAVGEVPVRRLHGGRYDEYDDAPARPPFDPVDPDQDEETAQPECQLIQVEREDRRINGYEVEYRYKGQLYMSRMDYDPGNKLRIRITVAPAD